MAARKSSPRKTKPKSPKATKPPRAKSRSYAGKSNKSARELPPLNPPPPTPQPPGAAAELPAAASSIIPKKLWVQWSGRQYKILDEQAQRYGIPVGEAKIDLAAVAVWIHDLLAAHGRRILAGDSASEIWDDLEAGDEPREFSSPALEKKREVEYQLRLRDLAERDGQLVSREHTRQGLALAAGIFKQFGDTLQRQFGSDALDLWNDALNDWERAIEAAFGNKGNAKET